MRLLHLVLASAALAACDEPADRNRAETGKTTLQPGSSSGDPLTNRVDRSPAAAARTPPASARADEIPAAFQGMFDESEAACARPSQYRLIVGSGELRFHESIGTVRAVSAESGSRLSVTADYQGEGESWRSIRRLSLSEDGATLTLTGDGTRLIRVRCP